MIRQARYLRSVEVLRLQPGDRIVLHLDGSPSFEQAKQLREALKAEFPQHQTLVVFGGRLSVQRDEPVSA